MRFIKPVIGIALIILSAAGIFYWENQGREKWTMTEVIVAAEEITEGSIVHEGMFKILSVPKESLIDGAMRQGNINMIIGKAADRDIPKNSQITSDFFKDESRRIEKGKSVFVIKPSWIDMRSSSLRAGDIVDIYSENGDKYLGTYPLAFVRDDNEREVVNEDGTKADRSILERKSSERAINHVEIISTLKEYEKIMAFVRDEQRGLMLIQKGGF